MSFEPRDYVCQIRDEAEYLTAAGERRAMPQARIEIPTEAVAAFCRRNRIRNLRLFGSVLREDFRDDSDVDFLVEFEPGEKVGLLSIATMELELGEIVGRKADLRTAGDLSRYFRDDVVRSAAVLYAA
jgi:uncharacterized protein